MTKRIFLANFTSAVLVAVISSVLLTLATYGHFLDVEKSAMVSHVKLAAQGVSLMGADYFTDLSEQNLRFTWLDSEGRVLYDSHGEAETMENHSDRDEVQEAILTGIGEDTRQSETILQESSYYALRLEDNTILRVSGVRVTVHAFFLSILQPFLLVILMGGSLSLVFAYSLSQGIMRPLSQLDLDNPMENNHAYDEIAPMLLQIQRQYLKNNQQLKEMSQQKEEFDIITRNMSEGLLLLDPKGQILSINDSASLLFQAEKSATLGKNILTLHRSVDMQHLLEVAMKGERKEGMIPLENQTYQVCASPIFQEDAVSGLAVLLVNATEKNEAEQIRREFTANVSHELKTPLHSISGCAELMSHNLVKEKDIPVFSQQIYSEAQRLIRLVEEIISLSRLDEGAEICVNEEIDLSSVASEVVGHLQNMAMEKDLTLRFSGEPVLMLGSYTMLSGLVRNLCENAIKYNRAKGNVEVRVENTEDFIRLQVNDTGIGLSEKDKHLIFQRFYRVDKSRSKEIGGTGLGLSIVKHTVALHKGSLAIESVPNVGTSIQIAFPKFR